MTMSRRSVSLAMQRQLQEPRTPRTPRRSTATTAQRAAPPPREPPISVRPLLLFACREAITRKPRHAPTPTLLPVSTISTTRPNKLHDLLRGATDRPRVLHSLVLVGGVLLVALHGVSDVAIYGLLGAKIATYAAQHDHGVSYTLYLLTFALDSVGDVFGSVFLVAAGLLIMKSGILPSWLRGSLSSPASCSSFRALASAASSARSGWCST